MNAPVRSRMLRELVIDSFAGGGGASEGIRIALGRDPDIAVNHDPAALAMHRANHPGTHHLVQDVAVVDAVGLCDGLPAGMLWMSPDCTDHSKAKGSAPIRDGDRTTRGIGWAIVGWVKALPMWQRPRVVFLENVEEYEDWGPLLPNGKRDPARKGETFRQFVAAWRALGYKDIEWRQRRAWVDGAGTIRNRLYMVMRRDGEPIVWPEPTHGNPNDEVDSALIADGSLTPWVPVADGLDFNLPCPSIFDTSAEIKALYGLRAKRPLAVNTMARVAKGVKRRVLDAPRPFLVKVNHSSSLYDAARDRPLDAPLSAATGKRDDALVAPLVAYAQHGGGDRPILSPGQTITASPKDQNQVITAFMAPRLQEKPGDDPRSRPVDIPAATIPASDSLPGHMVAAHIARQFGNSVSNEAGAPSGTLLASGDGKSQLVATYIAQQNDGPRQGTSSRPSGEPLSTVTQTGSQQTLIAASMMTMRNSGCPDSPADQPGRTLVADGAAETLIAASMMTIRGSDRRDSGSDEPGRTASAQGNHNALIRMPLMTVYYGADDDGASVDEPSRTETAKPRFGLAEVLATAPPFGPEHFAKARLVAEFMREHGCWGGGEFVTMEVDGVTVVLVDIGLRMLTPRERFNAQGFRPDYIIDHGIDEHGHRVPFTLEQQGYMCGNSVCPPVAAALVAANYRPREVTAPVRYQGEDLPLFMEAAE